MEDIELTSILLLNSLYKNKPRQLHYRILQRLSPPIKHCTWLLIAMFSCISCGFALSLSYTSLKHYHKPTIILFTWIYP